MHQLAEGVAVHIDGAFQSHVVANGKALDRITRSKVGLRNTI